MGVPTVSLPGTFAMMAAVGSVTRATFLGRRAQPLEKIVPAWRKGVVAPGTIIFIFVCVHPPVFYGSRVPQWSNGLARMVITTQENFSLLLRRMA
jgi:hypothetical protein